MNINLFWTVTNFSLFGAMLILGVYNIASGHTYLGTMNLAVAVLNLFAGIINGFAVQRQLEK